MKREWRIDEISGEMARVEQAGEIVMVPSWVLPAAARENDIVQVEESEVGERRRIELWIDVAGTRSALEASRRQVSAAPQQNDPGGPIKL